MRAQDAEQVRRLPLFRAMAQSNFEELSAAGYLQRFPAGVVLIHQGDRPDFLHVLVDGMIELFSSHGGQEATLSVLSPPAAFILAAVVVDDVYLKSARTLSPSTVVLIPADAVREVFERDAAFARAIVVELACRYRALVKELKNSRLRTGVQRLANWIIARDKSSGQTGRIRIPYEKRVLANQLGLRPENLSRALAELQHAGISVNGPEIAITDYRRLALLAKSDPLIDAPEPCERDAELALGMASARAARSEGI
jgi:CRP/FNR family transcriptional activator FtrB